MVELACRRIVFRILFLVACLSAASGAAGAAAQSDKLVPVDPSKVRVGGEIGRRIDITIRNNVLKIDNDAVFLKSFRAKNRGGYSYVGLGKHIDALVRLAFYTQDKKLIELKDHLIRELIKTQLPAGYIGIFRGGHMRVWWDLHEASYVVFGLVSDYERFGNKVSLAAAKKLADYMMKVRPRRPIVVHVSTIGFERAFIALYEATGEKKYLDHVTINDSLQNWRGGIGGHAYDIVSVCTAQLDMHRLKADPKLLRQSKKVVDFMLARDGMGVMGTGSNHEGWHSNQASSNKFGEACFTAYWLRLLGRLIQIEGKPIYGDVMERGIYNALFAVQSPGGRELHKYTPFEGQRHYYRGERSSDFQRDAYCCPNNFRRIIAELPNMIYYRSGGGLTVNLYTASSAEIKLSGNLSVGVRQETDYPNSGGVVIHVAPSKAAKFPVSLRIPRWCEAPKAAVNGEPVGPVKPGEFLVIDRTWRKGDRIELKMPMKLRLIKGRKVQKGKVAVMRGPMLFCLNPMRQAKRHPIFGGRRGERGEEFANLRAKLNEVNGRLGAITREPVDLADIVGGGNGFGSGKLGYGINPQNGALTTHRAMRIPCRTNTFVAVKLPFVDGIVVPDGGRDDKTAVPITSTGIKVTGIGATCGQTWDFVKNGPMYGQYTSRVGGVDYRAKERSILSLHANKAVTFDLAAIRKATGYGKLTFKTFACYSGRLPPKVDVAIYVDGRPALKRTALTRKPMSVEITLDLKHRFLTLMATDQNGDISHDQVFFGDPVLVPEPAQITGAATEKERGRLLAERDELQRKITGYATVTEVLRATTLDLTSLEGPVKDTTVRADGLAYKVKAWGPGADRKKAPNLELVLTEYADPGGEATYFAVSGPAVRTVDDELFR